MTVKNETSLWYRHMDLTFQAEALSAFVTKTIEEDLVEELNFLASYDAIKKPIQTIVDLPDRQIDLFIKFCLQNNGRLSTKKRSNHFAPHSDEEIREMEKAVVKNYYEKLPYQERNAYVASFSNCLDK